MVAAGDALSQLAQLGAVQHLAQFRLADQDDLQQFLCGRLQIGEQADLLEDLGGKVLRLIDDDDDAPAFGVRRQQPAIQGVHHLLDAVAVRLVEPEAELLADGEQELRGRHARIQYHGNVGMVRHAATGACARRWSCRCRPRPSAE